MPFPIIGAAIGGIAGGLFGQRQGGTQGALLGAAGGAVGGGLLQVGAQRLLGGAAGQRGVQPGDNVTVEGRTRGFLVLRKGNRLVFVKTQKRRQRYRVRYVTRRR